MFKHMLKKIIPATYNKVEAADNKLLRLIERKIDQNTSKIANDLELLQKEQNHINLALSNSDDTQTKIKMQLSDITDLLSEISNFNEISESRQKTILSSVAESNQKNSERFGKLYYHINEIEQNMSKNLFYTHKFEQNIIRNAFGDIKKDENFKKSFFKLIKNLDNESIDILIQIFNRIEKIYWAPENIHLDLYTAEEKEKIRDLKENFTDKIMKISSDLYYYNGYYLPINSFEDSVFYYRHGLDHLTTLDKLGNKAIMDVGGFIGDSILILSPLTTGKIYSFEAVQKNYNLMKKTVALNNIQNAVLVNKALGSSNCQTEISIAGSSSTIENCSNIKYSNTETVECITLDDYVTENNIDVGLIKVDIEGFEQEFLRGARKTIEQHKPILMISIYHKLDDLLNIKPMIEEWNLGYTFRIYRPSISKIVAETLLIGEIK